MAFCTNCGAQLEDGIKFCPSCGAKVGVSDNADSQSFSQSGTYVQQDASLDQSDTYITGVSDNSTKEKPGKIKKSAKRGGRKKVVIALIAIFVIGSIGKALGLNEGDSISDKQIVADNNIPAVTQNVETSKNNVPATADNKTPEVTAPDPAPKETKTVENSVQNSPLENANTTTIEEEKSDVEQPIETDVKEDVPANTEAPEVQVVVPEPTPSVTTGQKNALGSAKTYLSFTAFSYNGLIDQLEFEGYTNDEAKYAADNCGADWNEQALKSAKNYLSFTAFSYKGLIEQLEFEQFTKEQATYGADKCGADWKEQAAKSAANYLSFMSFSKQGLIDQLVFEGFTKEEAQYGASQNGY